MNDVSMVLMFVILTMFVCLGVWNFLSMLTGEKSFNPYNTNKFTTKVVYEDTYKTYSCVRVQKIVK